MRLLFLRFVAAVLAVVVMVPTSVQATLVTYNFSGEVRPGVSDTDFPVGDTFSGFFILDTNTSLVANNSDPSLEFFSDTNNAITDWSASFTNLPVTFSGNLGAVSFGNDTSTGDRIIFTLIGAANTALPNGRLLAFLQLDLFDPVAAGQDFLANDALPTTLNYSLLDSGTGRLNISNSTNTGGVQIPLSVNDIDAVSAVPVPAALPLFGTGLALMGFIGWRRKRKMEAT